MHASCQGYGLEMYWPVNGHQKLLCATLRLDHAICPWLGVTLCCDVEVASMYGDTLFVHVRGGVRRSTQPPKCTTRA